MSSVDIMADFRSMITAVDAVHNGRANGTDRFMELDADPNETLGILDQTAVEVVLAADLDGQLDPGAKDPDIMHGGIADTYLTGEDVGDFDVSAAEPTPLSTADQKQTFDDLDREDRDEKDTFIASGGAAGGANSLNKSVPPMATGNVPLSQVNKGLEGVGARVAPVMYSYPLHTPSIGSHNALRGEVVSVNRDDGEMEAEPRPKDVKKVPPRCRIFTGLWRNLKPQDIYRLSNRSAQARGGYAFSINFTPDKQEALMSSEDPVRFISKAFSSQFSEFGINTRLFNFSIEASASEKLHIHGSIVCLDGFPRQSLLECFRAIGGSATGPAKATAADIGSEPLYTVDVWTDYTTKPADRKRAGALLGLNKKGEPKRLTFVSEQLKKLTCTDYKATRPAPKRRTRKAGGSAVLTTGLAIESPIGFGAGAHLLLSQHTHVGRRSSRSSERKHHGAGGFRVSCNHKMSGT